MARLDPKNMRELMETLAPSWLRRFWGERLTGLVALFTDLSHEASAQAVKAPWLRQDTSPNDALPSIGGNANIEQVVGETDSQYRFRLADKWKLWEESATDQFAINALAPFGVEAGDITLLTTRDWSPDTSDNWSRWWILLDGTSGNLPWEEAEWGGTSWGVPGETWGTTATRDEIFGILRLLCKWKSAHEVGVQLVITYGAKLWGTGNEDWGDAGLVWAESTDVVRWPLGRFWGSAYAPFKWGTSTEPLRPEFTAVWGGKIRV